MAIESVKYSFVFPSKTDNQEQLRYCKLKTENFVECSKSKKTKNIVLSIISFGLAPVISSKVRYAACGKTRTFIEVKPMDFSLKTDCDKLHVLATTNLNNKQLTVIDFHVVVQSVLRELETREFRAVDSAKESEANDKIDYLKSVEKNSSIFSYNYELLKEYNLYFKAYNYTPSPIPVYLSGSDAELEFVINCKDLGLLKRYILKEQSTNPENAEKLWRAASEKGYPYMGALPFYSSIAKREQDRWVSWSFRHFLMHNPEESI